MSASDLAPSMAAPGRGPLPDWIFRFVGVFAYGVLQWLSLTTVREHGGVAAVAPASAVALAMIIRQRPLAWTTTLAGCFLASLFAAAFAGEPPRIAFIISAINITEVIIVAGCLWRWRGSELDFAKPMHLASFCILALSIPWGVALAAVPLVWLVSGAAPAANIVVRSLAHGLGFVVFTPALLLLRLQGSTLLEPSRRRELLSCGLILIVCLAGVFGQSRYPLLFLGLPAIVLMAFRFELEGAALAILATAVVAIAAAVAGSGPTVLIRGSPTERILTLQIFLATCSLLVLPIASILAQRRLMVHSLMAAHDKAVAAEFKARELQQFAAIAERLVGVGYWRRDLKTGEGWWSPLLFELNGLSPTERSPDPEVMLSRYHPEDQDRLRTALGRASREGAGFNEQLRYIRPDGEERIVKLMGESERAADGEITTSYGAYVDVTDIHRVEAALRESEARFRSWADNSTNIITHAAMDGRLTYVSPSAERLTGFEPAELIGGRFHERIHPEDAERARQAAQALMIPLHHPGSGGLEYRFFRKDGEMIWLEARPEILRDAKTGNALGITDIIRDITQRKQLEQELMIAREVAEAASQAKSDFLANMSHELRTPLTAIIGFSGLLKAKGQLVGQQAKFVDRIGDASQALLGLINNVLDLSKVDAGLMELESLPVEPRHVASRVVTMLDQQAKAKGLILASEVADDVPEEMLTDTIRLTQVLSNLVSNAVKFTASGRVTLTITRLDLDWLRFEVTDTGPGIPADSLERLFTRFVQAESSTTRNHGGTGLGLAISRGVIGLMGGRIGVDSQLGAGSTFWFEIPLIKTEPLLVGDFVEKVPMIHRLSEFR